MRVVWSPRSSDELKRIFRYILAHNPTAAINVYDEIERRVADLERFPHRGRPGRRAGTRELVIAGTPYFVVYRIRGNDVRILRVLHGRRKWP
jgi:toxin ParE1/3/4